MHYMSQELPSPPPPEVERPADGNEDGPPDFGNMGWRFCHEPIQKVKHPLVVPVRARSVLFLRNFHLQFTLFRISVGKQRSVWTPGDKGSHLDACGKLVGCTCRTPQDY
jgi:hypothetical protein